MRAAGFFSNMAAVVLPMAAGFAISPWLHPLAPAGVGFWPFALFMAAAMSITAFPVMARILKDRGMTQTRLGRLALSSAAIADVFAWIMLAFVLALALLTPSSSESWSRLRGSSLKSRSAKMRPAIGGNPSCSNSEATRSVK
jgi:Kef-type K+ transport system membrane component KefB